MASIARHGSMRSGIEAEKKLACRRSIAGEVTGPRWTADPGPERKTRRAHTTATPPRARNAASVGNVPMHKFVEEKARRAAAATGRAAQTPCPLHHYAGENRLRYGSVRRPSQPSDPTSDFANAA